MTKFNKTAVMEGLKELLRTSMMAVIPTVILDLQSQKFTWQVWAMAFVIALLSGIDKMLHKLDTGIINNNGLTGL
jgi:hypothetical protein